jgi:hypothetical protein
MAIGGWYYDCEPNTTLERHSPSCADVLTLAMSLSSNTHSNVFARSPIKFERVVTCPPRALVLHFDKLMNRHIAPCAQKRDLRRKTSPVIPGHYRTQISSIELDISDSSSCNSLSCCSLIQSLVLGFPSTRGSGECNSRATT